METIELLITIILVIISVLGVLLVLVQSSRGGAGGLFGDAGGSQSVIGSERRGDFFSRMTAIFLGIFIGGSFLLAYIRYQNNRVDVKPSKLPTIQSLDKTKKSDGDKPKETSKPEEDGSKKESGE